MGSEHVQPVTESNRPNAMPRWRLSLIEHAPSFLIGTAVFCTFAVKLFHAIRNNLLGSYPSWIISDVGVLVIIDAILLWVCFRWPRRWAVRVATVAAAVVLTWAMMNAGWLIRTGTQILPSEIFPLIRDPINIAWIVLVNMVKMPWATAFLVTPGAFLAAFAVTAIARPMIVKRSRRRVAFRLAVSAAVAIPALLGDTAIAQLGSTPAASTGLRYNCHVRAIVACFWPRFRHLNRDDFRNATRRIPTFAQIQIPLKPQHVRHNVVIVVLEGVQQKTAVGAAPPGSLEGSVETLTPMPHMADLAKQGVLFSNARSTVTHTTKALFAILTGRYPSASADVAETIPVNEPYASLATILENRLGYRTSFFQSAKGTFESRPGLIHNLGFDFFWAREDLPDPNAFVRYLGSDEFAMLDPIAEWIGKDDKPFLLTVLCSVTHDPYEVPKWFGEPEKDPLDRYVQAIRYTDQFIGALDVLLSGLGLAEETIFCVVGDHGEAFGEHGMHGHERIAYDEVLRVPLCLRAPLLTEAGQVINDPVSSVDLAPTLLSLLGFETSQVGFDGLAVLDGLPEDRTVYFSAWMQHGPAGVIRGRRKTVVDPTNATVYFYDLQDDAPELTRVELPEEQADPTSQAVIDWRRSTIFRIQQKRSGQQTVYDDWLVRWNGRASTVRHRPRDRQD